ILFFAILLFAPAFVRAQNNPAGTGTVIEIPAPGQKKSSGAEKITFERINLGKNVNSQYSELSPVLSSDETIMFFTRKGDPTNVGFAKNPLDEDIWYSLRQKDGSWGPAQHMGPPLNTANYDGVRAINNTATH